MILWLKKCHKWLSLLVGIQLLIWLGTGLYFNLMDHDKASGNKYRQRIASAEFDSQRLIEPKLVLEQVTDVVELKLITLLSQPYYLLTHEKGLYRHFRNDYSLVDAYSGKPVAIDETMAIALASASYKGPGQVSSASKQAPPHQDIPREKNDAWRVDFNDDLNTSVYLDAGSGRIIGHSNDDKRFVDIFFMLHFMDYGSEGSFNNIQIMVFAVFTLFFALTGFIWSVELGLNGQYRLTWRRRNKTLSLFDDEQGQQTAVTIAEHENLLDALLKQDIALPSSCGGGGSCGRCKVQVSESVKVTSADFHHFSAQQLEQGYRLACQHQGKEVEQLTLLEPVRADRHQLELVHSEFISPYIKELRFKVKGDKKVCFKAGAHMRFFIPAAKGVSIPERLPDEFKGHWHSIDHLEYEHKACSRNYSLANGDGSVNGGSGELAFTVKIQTAPNNKVLPGIGSSYICNLKVGQSIEAIGPFEDFHARPDNGKTMVLLGAGSGMAPLRALIEEQLLPATASSGKARDIHFYYGARSEQDLIYRDEFHHLSGLHNNFHYQPVLSRPDEDWLGEKGYVQDVLQAALAKLGDLGRVEFYLCGPPGMMSRTIEVLKAAGVEDDAISFDAFS